MVTGIMTTINMYRRVSTCWHNIYTPGQVKPGERRNNEKRRIIREKKEVMRNAPWWFKLSEEELKMYSISQLKTLCNALEKAGAFIKKGTPFYTLSATEVLQKSSGRIAMFTDDGKVIEETYEEAMSGASRQVLKDYLEEK